jgi:hypothetical protein
MAGFIDDMDEILKREAAKSVLGGKMSRQITKIETQQDKANKGVEAVQEVLKDIRSQAVDTVAQIKRISEAQGKPIGTQEITQTFNSMTQAINMRINKLETGLLKQFSPIQEEIDKATQLITSDNEEDQDKGGDLIEKLQDRLNLDIKQYSKEVRDAIEKLGKINQFVQKDNREKNIIHEKKIDELRIEKQNLEERGIYTRLDEKNEKLHIRSFEEEKKERNAIYEKELKIAKDKKDNDKLIENIKKNPKGEKGKLSVEQTERILALEENLLKDKNDVNKRREDMGMNKKGDGNGPFAQTIGASIQQFKMMGQELKMFAGGFKEIGGKFKAMLPSFDSFGGGLKGFGKGLLQGAANFGRLALATIGLIVEFFLLALPVIAVVAGIILLVSAIGKAADFLSNLWPFGKKKNKEGEIKPDETKSKNIDQQAKEGADKDNGRPDYSNQDVAKQVGSKAIKDQQDKIMPSGQTNDNENLMLTPEAKTNRSQGGPRATTLNKMSTDVASQQSSGNKNIVIAPSNQTITQASSASISMPMSANNTDNSFINLNSVSI